MFAVVVAAAAVAAAVVEIQDPLNRIQASSFFGSARLGSVCSTKIMKVSLFASRALTQLRRLDERLPSRACGFTSCCWPRLDPVAKRAITIIIVIIIGALEKEPRKERLS